MITQIPSYFDCEKVEKILENFMEILGDFSKEIAGHKTPNFEKFRKIFLKNAIKHTLWGDIKLQKCWGSPKFTSDGNVIKSFGCLWQIMRLSLQVGVKKK